MSNWEFSPDAKLQLYSTVQTLVLTLRLLATHWESLAPQLQASANSFEELYQALEDEMVADAGFDVGKTNEENE